MTMTLFHGSMEPLIYMLVITLGLVSMAWKFKTHKWGALIIEIGIFILVFKLHGGTMSGGFAATGAALICGTVIPLMFRK